SEPEASATALFILGPSLTLPAQKEARPRARRGQSLPQVLRARYIISMSTTPPDDGIVPGPDVHGVSEEPTRSLPPPLRPPVPPPPARAGKLRGRLHPRALAPGNRGGPPEPQQPRRRRLRRPGRDHPHRRCDDADVPALPAQLQPRVRPHDEHAGRVGP